MFDIGKVVFSARGSYVGMFKRPQYHGGGLWLRTLINSEWGSRDKKKMTTQLLKLMLCQDGNFVEYETEFLPHVLKLYNNAGSVQIHIANAYTVEMNMDHFDLVLEHDHDTLFATNISVRDNVFCADYPICRTCIEVKAFGGEVTYHRKTKRVMLRGCSRALISVKRSDLSYPEQSLKTAQQQQAEFEAFYSALNITGGVSRLAAYLLWSGTYSPLGYLKKECSPISKYKMGMLLMWANCFIGLSLMDVDEELALNNYFALMDYQKDDGSIPDAINPVISIDWFTKPPIYGYFFDLYRQAGASFDGCEEKLAHSLVRLAESWTRNQSSVGLCHYTHPWDSGMDNATCFDDILPISTPDLNTYMVLLYDTIAQLYKKMGKSQAGEEYANRSRQYLQHFIELSWNNEEFTALSDHGEQIVLTNACKYIPLILGERLPRAVVERMVEDLKCSGIVTAWSVASESVNSILYDTRKGDTFKPSAYWRGPVWPYFVFLICTGLRNNGYLQLAQTLERRFVEVVERNEDGIYENYDALTGTGYDDSSDIWSAAIYVMLKKRLEGSGC